MKILFLLSITKYFTMSLFKIFGCESVWTLPPVSPNDFSCFSTFWLLHSVAFCDVMLFETNENFCIIITVSIVSKLLCALWKRDNFAFPGFFRGHRNDEPYRTVLFETGRMVTWLNPSDALFTFYRIFYGPRSFVGNWEIQNAVKSNIYLPIT